MVNGAELPSAQQPKRTFDTNQAVTFLILAAYIVLLVSFIILSGVNAKTEWFELVKLGFTTLGSALTLVLGYYFGQREVGAFKEKEATQQKLEQVKGQVAEGEQKVSNLLEKLTADSKESQPDTLENVARRPVGRPKKDGE